MKSLFEKFSTICVSEAKSQGLNSEEELHSAFNAMTSVVWIVDKNHHILKANSACRVLFNQPDSEIIGKKCWEIAYGTEKPIEKCPVLVEKCPVIKAGHSLQQESIEIQINKKWFKVFVDPILDARGKLSKYINIIMDITEFKEETAFKNVKTLSGLLPICSVCKKIRDDKGCWNILEEYIEKHSDVSFSHGMCPECSDKLYGNEEWYIKMKNKNKDDKK
ncbi:PAS domain-containing protein [Desulfobacter latus]|nr:PAS domain-containing protein [Desulfobacter latus]